MRLNFSAKYPRRRRLVHHLTMSQTNTLLATTRTAQLTIGDNTTSFRHCPSVHTPTIFHFGFMSIKSLTVVNGSRPLCHLSKSHVVGRTGRQ